MLRSSSLANLAAVAAFVAVLAQAGRAQAQSLLPSSRDEVADRDDRLPGWTLDKFPPQPFMREIYWDPPSREMPAFFRDSMVQYVARTYEFARDNANGSRTQAWAAGGWLGFRSGLIADLFGIQVAFYGSEKLYAPANEGGSRLLAPGPDLVGQYNINTLGQLYGRIQLGDQEIRGGRQIVETPLINAQDNRMVPNTFNAVALTSLPDAARFYDYSVGYLLTMKPRDSNDFIPMSLALTGKAATPDEGAAYGMLRLRPLAGLTLTAMDYNVQNLLNSGFGQIEYVAPARAGLPLFMAGANVILQKSLGDNLLAGVPFETYQASAKLQMVTSGWTVFVAGSVTGNQSNIYSPYGTKPNYTDMQQVSFDAANEKAVGGSVAYDFDAFGLRGLNAGAWYAQGWGAINQATSVPIPNRRELDLWIQYRPTEGPLKGFRVKTQYSTLWQEGNVRDSQPEFRFIVDYTVLFRPPPSTQH